LSTKLIVRGAFENLISSSCGSGFGVWGSGLGEGFRVSVERRLGKLDLEFLGFRVLGKLLRSSTVGFGV